MSATSDKIGAMLILMAMQLIDLIKMSLITMTETVSTVTDYKLLARNKVFKSTHILVIMIN